MLSEKREDADEKYWGTVRKEAFEQGVAGGAAGGVASGYAGAGAGAAGGAAKGAIDGHFKAMKEYDAK